ncbi:hypothetical protein [Naumannella halotolerans]|uniref:hypothetical protein n=1 Tax=Naumannella halotolerans TaxID=993414 RepID=UPI00105BD350|nr:hypothetical protein [Naumannella halotolerans]
MMVWLVHLGRPPLRQAGFIGHAELLALWVGVPGVVGAGVAAAVHALTRRSRAGWVAGLLAMVSSCAGAGYIRGWSLDTFFDIRNTLEAFAFVGWVHVVVTLFAAIVWTAVSNHRPSRA